MNGSPFTHMSEGASVSLSFFRFLNICQRVCQTCTWGTTVEDELHVLFECPTYHHIRLKYEQVLCLLALEEILR
jgi:hypothetical protein